MTGKIREGMIHIIMQSVYRTKFDSWKDALRMLQNSPREPYDEPNGISDLQDQIQIVKLLDRLDVPIDYIGCLGSMFSQASNIRFVTHKYTPLPDWFVEKYGHLLR